MEIRELAEKVLFSDSLEEKLDLTCQPLTDTAPGPSIITPDRPGRPPELVMREDGSRVPRPRTSTLDDDNDRGRFFEQHSSRESRNGRSVADVRQRRGDVFDALLF